MRPHFAPTAVTIISSLAIAGCGGGGGGGGVMTPTITPSTTTGSPVIGGGEVPPSPPPPTQDLVAPALTSSPANQVAQTGTSFANVAAGTTFPLVLTAVGSAFSGDSATVASGGSIQQGNSGLTLSLNNSTLGVSGARANAFPYNSNTYDPRALNGQPVVALVADNLDYTRFGYWTLPDTNPYYDIGGGTWLAGYVTPVSQLPTSGSANYSGRVVGLASSYPTCQCADFKDFVGAVAMTANFGTRGISGSMTNLQFTDMEFNMIPLNDIGFAATLDPTKGTYSGATSALTFPTNPNPRFPFAVEPGATGTISGVFYGPAAQETGAVWTLSDGAHRLIGSFGAAKGP